LKPKFIIVLDSFIHKNAPIKCLTFWGQSTCLGFLIRKIG